MTPERTPEGLEARLKPRGVGRFFSAAFLALWLCGWLAGESFALWILIKGGQAVVTGRSLPPGADPPSPAGALAIGLFLAVWLSFWTLGGYLASRELLRLLWSEDRIVAGYESLVVRRRLGPFRWSRTVPRSSLVRIYCVERKGRMMTETTEGPVELTTLARGAECQALATAFQREMGLNPDVAGAPSAPPDRWRETIDDEGGVALIEDGDLRRTRGRVAWGLTFLSVSGLLALASYASRQAEALPILYGLGAMTAALAWSSWRISNTRLEWRLDPGRLRLRRRSGRRVKDLFEGDSLELVETSDSDGDSWFALNAVAAGAPPPSSPPRLSDRRYRRKIVHVMDDPTIPRRLGAWLAGRAGIRLDDRSTAASKQEELAALIVRLESGGRFSRWIAKHIPRPPA
jgi:hypothetical protein